MVRPTISQNKLLPDTGTAALSETVSEKPKRGRPRRFTDFDMTLARNYSNCKTIRGQQNVAYRSAAIAQLQHDERCRWLVDPERCMAGSGKLQFGILSELGRVENEHDRLSLAVQICQMDPLPRVRDAVAMIRRWRHNPTYKSAEVQP